ncbi:hypothetical protein AVEN_150770-1 [Araneus ventricosus]|uniref:Uncharacterized protein n=1 Tax=Araneus ventricosus TaxID=182803 RepID=A0A4Y2T328_ARAVE|nr:hypothetical protein AVEN_150770-1 [Araneus ventricosus]
MPESVLTLRFSVVPPARRTGLPLTASTWFHTFVMIGAFPRWAAKMSIGDREFVTLGAKQKEIARVSTGDQRTVYLENKGLYTDYASMGGTTRTNSKNIKTVKASKLEQ